MGRDLAPARVDALVVATDGMDTLIAKHLRYADVQVQPATHHGEMAAALFDECSHRRLANRVLFVLDLRISCGASVIDARLRDYDSVLNAYILSGNPWPQTLCLVEVEQTHPLWLQARPHLRATLLADEVQTVIGDPQQRDWPDRFLTALNRCLIG